MVNEIYTRTGRQVASAVKDKFGDIGAVQIDDTMILRWINQGIDSIVSTNPFLKRQAQTALLAGQGVYSLATAFPGLRIMQYDMVLCDGRKLEHIPFAKFQEVVGDTDGHSGVTEGRPAYFTEYGGSLTLWPTPSETVANGLTLYFAAYPDEVTTLDTEPLTVPDRFFGSLVDYVHAQALELDEDYEASQIKLQHHELGMQRQLERENISPTDFYPTVTDTTAMDIGEHSHGIGYI